MHLDNHPENETLPLKKALRHLVVFQIKLLVDALRDLFFSPISLVAFLIDAVTRPILKDSLSYKLMLAGRRSDRVINLFDEYHSSEHFTIDRTVAEVESALQRELQKRQD